jgi:excisionase family DNA binding protein
VVEIQQESIDEAPMQAPINDRLTMDVAEAAPLLGLSEAATYRAANSGQIPVLRLGKRVLILREPLMLLLKGGTQIAI